MPTPAPDLAALARLYLKDIRRIRADPKHAPELSLRGPLETFLNTAAHLNRQTRFINEGSGAQGTARLPALAP